MTTARVRTPWPARGAGLAFRAWLLASLVACLLPFCLTCAAASGPTIVLIGGTKSEGPGRHDYPAGVRRLQQLIAASPDLQGATVRAFPDGWPDDPAQLQDASTLLWYFDGLERHPLNEPARRQALEALLARGVGIVALHQATTRVAGDRALDLRRWVGAVRDGMADRTDEQVDLVPRTGHPVTRGMSSFALFDEFYPSLAFAPRGTAPLLTARLHPQARDGRPVAIGAGRVASVAWAFERPGGGRAVGFTGAHFLRTLDDAHVRRFLLNALLWTAGRDVPARGARVVEPPPAAPPAFDHTTFHHDRGRSGWNDAETRLSPASVAGGRFGALWESTAFDAYAGVPARAYASPLVLERAAIAAGPYRGEFSVVFAATSNGFVYAINADERLGVQPGTVLWRAFLGRPCRLEPVALDGILTGVLATPVIDVARQRIYVTSCEQSQRWRAFALNLRDGHPLDGWPVLLDEASFVRVDRNPGPPSPEPPRRHDYRLQRAALALSADGARLYIGFGESPTGWLVALDTAGARIASAFASVATPHRSSGGIWGAGGPAIDERGQVFVATGTGFQGYSTLPGNWAQSVLQLDDGPSGLTLAGSYTPFNHCTTAVHDVDLGSGGVLLLPGHPDRPLLALGGKQGNVYLVDRAPLPGRLDARPPCDQASDTDLSLLPPAASPSGRREPLNVFGPASDRDAAIDTARMRSVPAYFRDAGGAEHLVVSGTTRPAEGSADSVPPSLVRLSVDRSGAAPFLRVDATADAVVFQNPGSPAISSRGGEDVLVWVLDTGVRRSALLLGRDAPQPVLVAFDARLKLLWRSAPGELRAGGKYNEPVVANGRVFVATDRVHAFGLRDGMPIAAAVSAPASPGDATSTIDAAAVYAQRCATCHDAPQGRIPPRSWLATRDAAELRRALIEGAMKPMAAGLDAEAIDALVKMLKAPPR